MATLNIALVGCGGRGTGAAANALASTKATVRLVAMADAFQDRLDGCYAQLSGRNPGRVDVPTARRYVGLTAFRNAVDQAEAVVIATPPGFHPMLVEYAINKGKHVFVEKPVAVDGPGVRRVLAAANKADLAALSIGVGLQDLHKASEQAAVARLRGGGIGRILFARGSWEGAGVWLNRRTAGQSELNYQLRNWYYFPWLSGDHIVEQNVHVISRVCWIKDAFPTACQGVGGRQSRTGNEYGQIYDHHAVDYEFADGCYFHNRCRQVNGADTRLGVWLVGDQGTCDLGTAQIIGPNAWKFSGPDPDPYQAEMDAWIDSIVTKRPYNEAHHAAYASLTAIMGRMATYTGGRVTWEEALGSEEKLAPDVLSFGSPPPTKPDASGSYPVAMPGRESFEAKWVGHEAVVDITGHRGRTYQIEVSETAGGPWASLGDPVVSRGDPQTVRDPAGPQRSRFYRWRRDR